MTDLYTHSQDGMEEPVQGREDSSTAAVAKEQASDIGSSAVESGQHVAAMAKDEAANVATEAQRQAKDLLRQAQTEIASQSGTQQQRLAGSLHALGDELHSMASNNEQPGVATDLARQAAGKTKDVAAWLESREPGDVLTEVKAFARQRPMAFLAIALGAGVVAGRLTRGIKDAPSDPASGSSTSTAPEIARTTTSGPMASDVRAFASSQDGDAFDLTPDLDQR
jgi:hypothetical protein